MLILPQNLASSVTNVRARIARAADAAGRSVDSVTLLAVGKSQPVEALEAVTLCGVTDLGENYVQEALAKMQAFDALHAATEPPPVWHHIGRLQANKTRAIAEHFSWVHGIDRLQIAERLSAQRRHHGPPLQVCLQVDVAGEPGKGGVPVDELRELAAQVVTLPRLQLRGLMCLPPAETEHSRQRAWFAAAREAMDSLVRAGLPLDTLSMGMSADLEAAIAEGATIVRVGSAIFGPRSRPGPETG